jgi:hypothetical protein
MSAWIRERPQTTKRAACEQAARFVLPVEGVERSSYWPPFAADVGLFTKNFGTR